MHNTVCWALKMKTCLSLTVWTSSWTESHLHREWVQWSFCNVKCTELQYVGSFGERAIETWRWEETGMWSDVSMSVKISYITTKCSMLGIYSPHILDTFTLNRVAVYFPKHLWPPTKLDGVMMMMMMMMRIIINENYLFEAHKTSSKYIW
jgi:hypothetical protein